MGYSTSCIDYEVTELKSSSIIMKLDILKYLGSGAKMMAMLPFNLLSGKAEDNYPVRTTEAWDEEREDILQCWQRERI